MTRSYLLLVSLGLVAISACAETVTPLGDNAEIVSDRRCVDAAGGTLSIAGARVIVPRDAVDEEICVTLDAIDEPLVFAAGQTVSPKFALSFDPYPRFFRTVRVEIDYQDTPATAVYYRGSTDWISFVDALDESEVGSVQFGQGFVSVETLRPGEYVLASLEERRCDPTVEEIIECRAGEFCNAVSMCQQRTCDEDWECDLPAVCVDELCVPSCDVNTDCRYPEICREGACTTVYCDDAPERCDAYGAVCLQVDAGYYEGPSIAWCVDTMSYAGG